jgi:hypothetical protein
MRLVVLQYNLQNLQKAATLALAGTLVTLK